MNSRAFIPVIALIMITVITSCCKNGKKDSGSAEITSSAGISADGLVLIGKDIISEVVVRPDTLGDPWEIDKVKGFNGIPMFTTLFERIYDEKLTVYDCLNEEMLTPTEVRKLEKEFNSDLSRIGKLQFLEDWYFDPATNGIVKKIRSVSLGYVVDRTGGLPPGYFPLFRVKME
jgi:hypothetical protein